MGQPAFDGDNAVPLRVMIEDADISVEELWLYYISLTGDLDQMEIDAYLHGLMPLPQHDRNLLAHSVHEMRATPAGNPGFTDNSTT